MIYASVSMAVYPKYSFIEPRFAASGLRLHRVHLKIGFGTDGEVLHGTTGKRIEAINAAAETIPEYINFFLNCIIFY